MQIIGIVGQQGSGKDTAAKYIAKRYGFKHISTGDQIRAYIIKNNLGETSRDVIQNVIIKLRKKDGPSVIVDHILMEYPNTNLVLSGLRHPAEVQKICDKKGFIIALEANQIDRYKRSKDRKRIGDEINFQTFAELEARENGTNPETFNIQALMDMAKDRVKNTGSFKYFYAQIDKIMLAHGLDKI